MAEINASVLCMSLFVNAEEEGERNGEVGSGGGRSFGNKWLRDHAKRLHT